MRRLTALPGLGVGNLIGWLAGALLVVYGATGLAPFVAIGILCFCVSRAMKDWPAIRYRLVWASLAGGVGAWILSPRIQANPPLRFSFDSIVQLGGPTVELEFALVGATIGVLIAVGTTRPIEK